MLFIRFLALSLTFTLTLTFKSSGHRTSFRSLKKTLCYMRSCIVTFENFNFEILMGTKGGGVSPQYFRTNFTKNSSNHYEKCWLQPEIWWLKEGWSALWGRDIPLLWKKINYVETENIFNKNLTRLRNHNLSHI